MGNLLKSDVLDIDQFVVEDRKRAQKEPRKRQSRSRTRFKYRHSQSPASCCITNNIVGESPEKDSREAEQDLNIDTVNHQPPVASQIILWERNLPGWQDFCSIGSWAKYFYNFFSTTPPFHDPTVLWMPAPVLLLTLLLIWRCRTRFRLLSILPYSQNHCRKWKLHLSKTYANLIKNALVSIRQVFIMCIKNTSSQNFPDTY